MKCGLCAGLGENLTGIDMEVNNHICPRCGGYGTVPNDTHNPDGLTDSDNEFIDCNRRVSKGSDDPE